MQTCTIEERLKERGHKYGFVVGYDGVQASDCPAGMEDVMLQTRNALPDMEYLDLIISLYKPLEVRGQFRDMIWVDMFDNEGYKIDLPKVIESGEVVRTGKVW